MEFRRVLFRSIGGGERSELGRGEAADLSGGDLAEVGCGQAAQLCRGEAADLGDVQAADLSGGQSGEVCGVERSERSEERRVGKECRARWAAGYGEERERGAVERRDLGRHRDGR